VPGSPHGGGCKPDAHDRGRPRKAQVKLPSEEAAMQPYLRLRQVCLASPHLQASSALIRALLGVEECYRDANVAAYGLENALFPIGADRFLEVVCPTGPGTAVGRFLQQTQGRGGYMVIFDCDDPKVRAERAAALGVRIAHHIDRASFQGYQLHPKDCRASFLEFDRTSAGEDLRGAYWPAGEHWQRHVKTDVTRELEGVELLSHDPAGLAQRWSAIIGLPVSVAGGRHVIEVDRQRITILAAPGAARERFDALALVVRDAHAILARARQMGLETREDAFALCGVWMRLREHGT
jgi:hypothetical protein